MKLEDQVVSLELAKRFKELGVRQESIFFWGVRDEEQGGAWELWEVHRALDERRQNDPSFKFVATFTVAELGEMLPPHYMTIKSRDIENLWHCNDINDFIAPDFKKGILEHTEAAARAKMLIYLIENKLITLL